MSDYENEYVFVMKAEDESLRFLTATEDTVERKYLSAPQPVGSTPFVFFNGSKATTNRNKPPRAKKVPDVLFNGNNLVVRNDKHEQLLRLNIPGLLMHPAIYIDDFDRWHEDFWYLHFWGRTRLLE